MSTPSTVASPSTGGTNAIHGTHGRANGHGHRKGSAQDAPDQFSNLLSLLSASDDGLPALAIDTLDTACGTTADPQDPTALTTSGDANLAAMMQWAELPPMGAGKGHIKASGAGHGASSHPVTAAGDTGTDPLAAAPIKVATAQGADALPQGMHRLEHPEHLDPNALAQAPDAAAAASQPVATADSESAPQESLATAAPAKADPAAPVSDTPTRTANAARGTHPSPTGTTSTQSLQQSHHQMAQVQRAQFRLDTSDPVSLRSTLSLDKRFADASASEDRPGTSGTGGGSAGPLAASATGPSFSALAGAGAELGGQASGGHTGGQQQDAQGFKAPDDASGTRFDGRADELAQAEERLDSFATPQLHKASLRVGEHEGDAIDIQLSMTGQALDLGFRTDDAEARAALARHAQGNLSDVLQRSGIQLGDVSIASHNGQQQGAGTQSGNGSTPSSQGQADSRSLGRSDRGTGGEDQTVAHAPQRPRAADASGLDLFI